MKKGIRVLLEILIFGLTYGGVIVIILTYLKLFKKKLSKFSVLLPLCIMGFLFILLIISNFLGILAILSFILYLFHLSA